MRRVWIIAGAVVAFAAGVGLIARGDTQHDARIAIAVSAPDDSCVYGCIDILTILDLEQRPCAADAACAPAVIAEALRHLVDLALPKAEQDGRTRLGFATIASDRPSAQLAWPIMLSDPVPLKARLEGIATETPDFESAAIAIDATIQSGALRPKVTTLWHDNRNLVLVSRGYSDTHLQSVKQRLEATAAACQRAKDHNVHVFTIGLIHDLEPQDSSASKAMLRACASSLRHDYTADNAPSLITAVQDIALKARPIIEFK